MTEKEVDKKFLRSSFGKISKVPGVVAFPVMPQSIRSGGVEKPVQFVLLGNTYEKLNEWKDILKKEARKNPNLISIEDDYNLISLNSKLKLIIRKLLILALDRGNWPFY